MRACVALLLFAGASSATARLDEVVKRDISTQWIRNFLTVSCTNEQVANLATLLNAQWQALSDATTDLGSQPGRSTHGFSLFFNTKRNVAIVQEAIKNLLAQKPKTFPLPGLGGANPSPPNLICLGSDTTDPVSVEMYGRCAPGKVAFYRVHSPAIFICPLFWQRPRSIPTTDDCPKPTSTLNQFSVNRDVFLGSQYNALLHELIHFYEYPASNLQLEAYDVNDCIALPGRKSVLNAQNYAYYIMGKF